MDDAGTKDSSMAANPKASECIIGEVGEEASEMEATRKVLLSKLAWARSELEHSSSVECCTQMCTLIQSIAVTMKHMKPQS